MKKGTLYLHKITGETLVLLEELGNRTPLDRLRFRRFNKVTGEYGISEFFLFEVKTRESR